MKTLLNATLLAAVLAAATIGAAMADPRGTGTAPSSVPEHHTTQHTIGSNPKQPVTGR